MRRSWEHHKFIPEVEDLRYCRRLRGRVPRRFAGLQGRWAQERCIHADLALVGICDYDNCLFIN